MGRKPITIDLTEVERLAGLGLTEEEIAASLGISRTTLHNRRVENEQFEQALKRGRANAASKVANALFTKAVIGDVAAIVWYEKTRRGLSDKVSVNWQDEARQRGIDPEQIKREALAAAVAALRAGTASTDD